MVFENKLTVLKIFEIVKIPSELEKLLLRRHLTKKWAQEFWGVNSHIGLKLFVGAAVNTHTKIQEKNPNLTKQ